MISTLGTGRIGPALGFLTANASLDDVVLVNRDKGKAMGEALDIVNNPDESVWELAEIMKLRGIHKVPVVRESRLVGIVTATDLQKLCSAGSDSEMRKIADQILLRMKP